jgi:hypothetical protein
MQSRSFASHGVKWGLIIGVVYCILLWLRFMLGENSPVYFGLFSVIGYIVVIVLMVVSASQMRTMNGGYIDTKTLFKGLFISVLIFELMYAIFNFIYLKYIDPDFYVNFRDASEKLLLETKQPQKDIDSVLEGIDVDAPKKMNLLDLLKSYLFFVGVSGVFAFFIALIMKKNPPVTETVTYTQE